MCKRGCVTLFALAMVGALLGLLSSAVITYVMPKLYESEAVIEVKPRPAGVSSAFKEPGMQMSPQFFATEFEKIKSRKLLEKVVDNLFLPSRWNVDKEAAILTLRDVVTTQNIRGTDLISIRVRHTSRDEARDIAEAVAKSYREYRDEIETRDEENVLMELNKAVRDQEDKVEERRKLLATIVRAKGILYKGPQTGARPATNREELEDRRNQLSTQLRALADYQGEQRYLYASGMDFVDNPMRDLFPRYKETLVKVESMKSDGFGQDHPTLLVAVKQLEELERQCSEAIVSLRQTLSSDLKLVENALASVEDDAVVSEKDARETLDKLDYVDAKRDFEVENEILQNLKLKKVSADIGLRIPFQSVEIHDQPMVSESPISPNVTLNLVLGTVAGVILFPIVGLLVMGVMRIARGTPK